MESLNDIVSSINGVLWSSVIIVLLVGAGVYFTIRTKAVQLRYFGTMFKLIANTAGTKTEGNEISPFQAFCVSTASRVGVGNIAGIAIAIVSGGPGAIFWMWVSAFFGMATIYGRKWFQRRSCLLPEKWFGPQTLGSYLCHPHFRYLRHDLQLRPVQYYFPCAEPCTWC